MFFFTRVPLNSSRAERESGASASGISHAAVAPLQPSLPPVKGHGVDGPAEGSGSASRCALVLVVTGGLLMCGLVCFIWRVALWEPARRLSVLWV